MPAALRKVKQRWVGRVLGERAGAMPTNFGYQGFQSWGMMTQPAMKPGETTETRASKFADVGHGVVYRNAPVSENLRDDTVTKMAFATVKASDYTVPDRRGISTLFSKGLPEPKKFLGKSMHHTSADLQIMMRRALRLPWLVGSQSPIATFESMGIGIG